MVFRNGMDFVFMGRFLLWLVFIRTSIHEIVPVLHDSGFGRCYRSMNGGLFGQKRCAFSETIIYPKDMACQLRFISSNWNVGAPAKMARMSGLSQVAPSADGALRGIWEFDELCPVRPNALFRLLGMNAGQALDNNRLLEGPVALHGMDRYRVHHAVRG